MKKIIQVKVANEKEWIGAESWFLVPSSLSFYDRKSSQPPYSPLRIHIAPSIARPGISGRRIFSLVRLEDRVDRRSVSWFLPLEGHLSQGNEPVLVHSTDVAVSVLLVREESRRERVGWERRLWTRRVERTFRVSFTSSVVGEKREMTNHSPFLIIPHHHQTPKVASARPIRLLGMLLLILPPCSRVHLPDVLLQHLPPCSPSSCCGSRGPGSRPDGRVVSDGVRRVERVGSGVGRTSVLLRGGSGSLRDVGLRRSWMLLGDWSS